MNAAANAAGHADDTGVFSADFAAAAYISIFPGVSYRFHLLPSLERISTFQNAAAYHLYPPLLPPSPHQPRAALPRPAKTVLYVARLPTHPTTTDMARRRTYGRGGRGFGCCFCVWFWLVWLRFVWFIQTWYCAHPSGVGGRTVAAYGGAGRRMDARVWRGVTPQRAFPFVRADDGAALFAPISL